MVGREVNTAVDQTYVVARRSLGLYGSRTPSATHPRRHADSHTPGSRSSVAQSTARKVLGKFLESPKPYHYYGRARSEYGCRSSLRGRAKVVRARRLKDTFSSPSPTPRRQPHPREPQQRRPKHREKSFGKVSGVPETLSLLW